MTEKVKVTKEQEDVVQSLMEEPYYNSKDNLLVEHSKDGGFSPLLNVGVTLPLLAKILYGEYEVEPEFKVGDWVTDIHPEDNVTGKITKLDTDPYGNKIAWGYYSYDDVETYLDFEEIRHATTEEIAEEKERRWWAKHGRDPWELKKEDLLKNTYSKFIREVVEIFEVDGSQFIRFSSMGNRAKESIIENYEVVCFAEQRLDVRSND